MIDDPLSKDHFRKQKYSLLVFLHSPAAAGSTAVFFTPQQAEEDIKALGWVFFFGLNVDCMNNTVQHRQWSHCKKAFLRRQLFPRRSPRRQFSSLQF